MTTYVIEFRWHKRRRWMRCVRQYDSLVEARLGVKKKFTDQKDADLYQTRIVQIYERERVVR